MQIHTPLKEIVQPQINNVEQTTKRAEKNKWTKKHCKCDSRCCAQSLRLFSLHISNLNGSQGTREQRLHCAVRHLPKTRKKNVAWQLDRVRDILNLFEYMHIYIFIDMYSWAYTYVFNAMHMQILPGLDPRCAWTVKVKPLNFYDKIQSRFCANKIIILK